MIPHDHVKDYAAVWTTLLDVWHFHLVLDENTASICDASETILQTVQSGLDTIHELEKLWARYLLHICASDTSKYISKEDRERFSKFHGEILDDTIYHEVLPQNISSLLQENNITQLLFTSQVKCTNTATTIIKKAKKHCKKILQDGEKKNHYLGTRGALNFFGILSPLAQDTSISYYNISSDSLRDTSIIWLYGEKWTLCPASCMGMFATLIKKVPACASIISIYDEHDDYTIKKKLFQWAIAFLHLHQSDITFHLCVTEDLDFTLQQIVIPWKKISLDAYAQTLDQLKLKYHTSLEKYWLVAYWEHHTWDMEHMIAQLDCWCGEACNIL